MGGISTSALLFDAIYTHVPIFLTITGTLSNFILMTALFWHGGARRVKAALFDTRKLERPLAFLVIISASICSCLDILQAYLSLPGHYCRLPCPASFLVIGHWVFFW